MVFYTARGKTEDWASQNLRQSPRALVFKLGLKFQQNTDPVMRAVYEESKLEERMPKIARSVRMHRPITKREVDKYRARETKLE
jgi:hypothetical protein